MSCINCILMQILVLAYILLVDRTLYIEVWKRLTMPVHLSVARDVLYILVHNKLPVRERMFRIGLSVDPYCDQCPGGAVCDLEHFFCSCLRVANVWGWVRRSLVSMLGGSSNQCSNWELINFLFPKSGFEDQCVWLRERSQFKNRLNLGHCPTLSAPPPL